MKRELFKEPITIKYHHPESASTVNLPHPVLLRVHHIVAQILNATGAGERIDEILRHTEGIDQFEEGGQTDVGQILSWALLQHGIVCS